jgi:cation diffusion facilitator CzcD-associated flavoprotein CzcO
MTGCTAVQILPEIAKVAEHVTVFQRTPNWIVPRNDAPVSALQRGIYKYVPGALSLTRGAWMEIREYAHNIVKSGDTDLSHMMDKMAREVRLPSLLLSSTHPISH